MIQNSLEWSGVRDRMLFNVRNCRYRNDVERMIKNISSEVTELSKAEVDYRRGKKHKAVELLEKINQDIEIVQDFILVAKLAS